MADSLGSKPERCPPGSHEHGAPGLIGDAAGGRVAGAIDEADHDAGDGPPRLGFDRLDSDPLRVDDRRPSKRDPEP